MPRYTRGIDEPRGNFQGTLDKLVHGLLHELSQPKGIGQPIILEDHTPETKSVRVHVVWDDWEDCPREFREQIIRKAYEELDVIPSDEQITLAVGLTVPEAAAVGLLPFQVLPGRKARESSQQEEYRRAMLAAGASTLHSGENPELRFPSLEDAEAAMEHLESQVPGSKWIITKEIFSPEES